MRAARPTDLPALAGIARHLDSVNLPGDEARLAEIVARSQESFARRLPPERREYMFVLEEHERVLGCSMLFAQHGTRQAPHVFFDVLEEERYSDSIDRLFQHTVLRIGFHWRGMTEIGGLVVLPEHRGRPERLGQLLSYVRFLYIALHRAEFKDTLVAELMPPLEPDGRSLLWEALGRRFTGLSYQEADRLSRENKEFIKALFPQEPIYACLLDPAARALIGQVGPATQGVARMLRAIGFEYARRIDPFDGGPHFHARTDEVAVVRGTRRVTLVPGPEPGEAAGADGESAEGGGSAGETCWALVAAPGARHAERARARSEAGLRRPSAPPAADFLATRARVLLRGDTVTLAPATQAQLQLAPGDPVALYPLPERLAQGA